MADAPKARDILAALFADVPGFVELRALDLAAPAAEKHKGRAFVHPDDGNAIDGFAAEHVAAGHNVYFGCATRRDGTSGRAENCCALPVLFADLDFAGDEGREAAAMSQLVGAPIAPALVTRSGGGLHAFWKLAAPLPLDTPGAQAAAVVWLRRLAQALDGDPKCAEVARVLRLSGSQNFKYSPPRRVEILSWAPDAVADLAALNAWLPALVEPVRPPWPSAPATPTPADTVSAIARVRAYLAATPPAIQGQGGDEHTFKVCCRITRGFGLSPADAWPPLLEWNARCQPPWIERDLQAKLEHAARNGREPIGARRDTPPARREGFALTDLGNGEHFAHSYGDRVRFDHRRKRWLVWASPTWRPDADATVQRLAHAAVRRRYTEAGRLDDTDAKRAAANWAIKSQSRDRLAALLSLAATLGPIADSGDAWDADPFLLGCPNGVVDLRTGTLRAGRPEDRLTLRTGVAFDPAAPAPRFERFLNEIFDGDGERISWLTRAVGYSLTGATSEQIFFLLHGRGANGKGALTRALSHALGDYGFNLPFSTFEARPSGIPNDLAALVGRRFVTASEANDGTRLNEARIKSLTGEDSITARFLHGEFFQFRPVGKLWLQVNHRPVVRDQSHGFWRRVRLIPFDRTFPIDKTLDPALHAEAAGVLAWAVRGCLRWQVEGLGDLPAAVTAAVTAYQTDSDPLAAFLAENTARIDEARAGASALYKRYCDWADGDNVPKSARLTATAFGRTLGERGVAKKHTAQGWFYLGIALKSAATEAA